MNDTRSIGAWLSAALPNVPRILIKLSEREFIARNWLSNSAESDNDDKEARKNRYVACVCLSAGVRPWCGAVDSSKEASGAKNEENAL